MWVLALGSGTAVVTAIDAAESMDAGGSFDSVILALVTHTCSTTHSVSAGHHAPPDMSHAGGSPPTAAWRHSSTTLPAKRRTEFHARLVLGCVGASGAVLWHTVSVQKGFVCRAG
jgi:hypothetical protein